MFAGSSGVLFCLYKYSLLLNQETGGLEPRWLDHKLSKTIEETVSEVSTQKKGQPFASFLRGQVVGPCTLAALNLLKEKEVDLAQIGFLVSEKILKEFTHC
jgi:hypothetical protein